MIRSWRSSSRKRQRWSFPHISPHRGRATSGGTGPPPRLTLTVRLLEKEHIDLPIAPVVWVQAQHLFADDAAEDLASYGDIQSPR